MPRLAAATQEDLEAIDGIGPIVARAIAAHFENEGNARIVAELDAAGVPHSGIQEEFGGQFICFKDPDDIPWELYYPPPR